MPDLTITDLPDDLLEALGRSAAANHRSIEDEVRIRLEDSVGSTLTDPGADSE